MEHETQNGKYIQYLLLTLCTVSLLEPLDTLYLNSENSHIKNK